MTRINVVHASRKDIVDTGSLHQNPRTNEEGKKGSENPTHIT
jgi:hypothetical protein